MTKSGIDMAPSATHELVRSNTPPRRTAAMAASTRLKGTVTAAAQTKSQAECHSRSASSGATGFPAHHEVPRSPLNSPRNQLT